MHDIPPITVGLLKEIWKENNVSDDDVIEFNYTNMDEHEYSGEIEFDRLYKREFGIIMDFKTIESEEDNEPTDLQMMQAYGTKWHDGL